ncbi:hypothetical protein M422DRAFT_276484, partial [Sphaerobolus stellatus SS14]
MSSSLSNSPSPHDELWNVANPDMDALDTIITQHFHADTLERVALGDGGYGRAFIYTFNNGRQVVAKVILPVRPVFKTESEVAAMILVKEKTSIPVPDVYLYCSTADNPVRAEWILMQYLQGERFTDCFEDLSNEKRYRTAKDLAKIISPIFNITASYCGSVLPGSWCNALRYPIASPFHKANEKEDVSRLFLQTGILDPLSGLRIGPINDSVFLDYPNQVPLKLCGPFRSDQEWMEAAAYLGIPGTRTTDIKNRYSFDKLVEVFDIAKQFEYP